MAVYFGAEHNLINLIQTHLFVLCPNNSGSTFLIGAIGQSRNVWSLPREGQHVAGFVGPHSRGTEKPLTWGSTAELLEWFRNDQNYDWAKTKRAWYFQATAHDSNARIFATKSPPFLLIPDQLSENFKKTKFIVMVRNPYAMAEGILRRRPNTAEMTREVAGHVVKCFQIQASNAQNLSDQSICFTYEDMCDRPNRILKQLVDFLPELHDVTFHEAVSVKGMYDQAVTNFNTAQIQRLSVDQLGQLNDVFQPHAELFAKFGYRLLPAGEIPGAG